VAAGATASRSQEILRSSAAERGGDHGDLRGAGEFRARSGIGARRMGGHRRLEVQAVSSAAQVAEREAAKRYLQGLDACDQQEEMVID